MFFDDINQIPKITAENGFSLFVLPTIPTLNFKNSYTVEPKDGKIRIDQIRDIMDFVGNKSHTDRYILVINAEKMNIEAQNAFLKLLEEPQENYHFVFLANSISGLLETILSRAAIYVLRQDNPITAPINADEDLKNLAKLLITTNGRNLVQLANTCTDKKLHKNPREDVLAATAVAIEMLYKSYFATQNPKFLKKINQLLTLHQNLTKNGHIKLHIVADLC